MSFIPAVVIIAGEAAVGVIVGAGGADGGARPVTGAAGVAGGAGGTKGSIVAEGATACTGAAGALGAKGAGGASGVPVGTEVSKPAGKPSTRFACSIRKRAASRKAAGVSAERSIITCTVCSPKL